MLGFLRNIIIQSNGKELLPIKRIFNPKYFLDKNHQLKYERDGYVIIPNVVSNKEIEKLRSFYKTLSEFKEFQLSEKFVNSGRFQSKEIRKYVVDKIREFTPSITSRIFDSNNCELKNGGNFQIKPPSEKSVLNPHQDSPIINENEFYAIYIWIPLEDITMQNGALTVLPKSHLWGNHQRSLNVPWQLSKYSSILNNYMIPLEVKAGDVICFDSALIHASLPNLTNQVRLAITTSALPLNYQLIEYFKDKNTPKNKVEVYEVDESYYVSQNINERPKNIPKKLEDANPFIYKIDKRNLKKLIHHQRDLKL